MRLRHTHTLCSTGVRQPANRLMLALDMSVCVGGTHFIPFLITFYQFVCMMKVSL